jgi:hypothetical protein
MVESEGVAPTESLCTTDLQSALSLYQYNSPYKIGESGGTRTPNLKGRNLLLYPLSYRSVNSDTYPRMGFQRLARTLLYSYLPAHGGNPVPLDERGYISNW